MINSQTIKEYFDQLQPKNLLQKIDSIIANQNDIIANNYLAPLSTSYLPWTQSAMRPSGLVAVLNEITINRRQSIVECGGGISTFYIARLLKEKGGHLYTIEHDQKWCELLGKELAKENLSEQVSLIFAPLNISNIEIEINQENTINTNWYSLPILEAKLSSLKIDFLMVDGPPAYALDIQFSRYPAVPFLSPYFAEDYTVILDDINRPGEQKVVEAWEAQLGIVFERRLSQGNIAIGRGQTSLVI